MSPETHGTSDADHTPAAGPAPAAWYPDGTGGQRWWDGVQWTEHYQPAAPVVPTETVVPTQPSLEASPQGPRTRSPLMIVGIVAAGVIGLGLIVSAVILSVSLLQPSSSIGEASKTPATAEPAPTLEPAPSTEPTPDAEPTEEPGNGIGDALAEREDFMRTQQQPTDGSLLAAKTPEQKAFVAEAKEYIEGSGGVWDAQTESYALALTLDACETSILNGHKVDESTVRTHASTSPLLAALIQGAPAEQQAALKSGLMNLAVTGVRHVCPTDFDQWKESVDAIGDSW